MKLSNIAAIIVLVSMLSVVLVVGSVSVIKEYPLSGSSDKPMPSDRISYDGIHAAKDSVSIDIENPVIVAVANTGSMLPTFNENSNLIEIVPKSEKEIHVGDIVSYQRGSDIIVHRIIEIGNDDNGWYAVFKGDNNPAQDPDKVRFEQIRRLVVGIVY
jgi:hypothetical protein